MTEVVLDASALIAFLRNEPGASKVADVLPGARISAVNLSETLAKMAQYGKPLDAVAFQVDRLGIPVIPFDAEQAHIAASLGQTTRHLGLSLGDRACLALGVVAKSTVLTADQEWSKVDAAIEIQLIR